MSVYQDYTIAMPMLATPTRKMDTIVHAWVAFLETEHLPRWEIMYCVL